MQTLRKKQRRRDAPEHSWKDSLTTEKAGLIDWLFIVLRPAQEYFTYMEKAGEN
jgi:hypothetical protein